MVPSTRFLLGTPVSAPQTGHMLASSPPRCERMHASVAQFVQLAEASFAPQPLTAPGLLGPAALEPEQ
jgi:hypothetical protein